MRQPTDRTDKVKRENSERAGRAKAGNLPLMLGPLLLTRQVLEQEATHVINAAKKVAEEASCWLSAALVAIFRIQSTARPRSHLRAGSWQPGARLLRE